MLDTDVQISPSVLARVFALVDQCGGLADPAQRDHLGRSLASLLGQDLDLLSFTPTHVIEPISGLRFYPVSKLSKTWTEHARGLPRPNWKTSRDPFGFMLDAFDIYIKAGLLYSGHVKTVAPDLYNALWSQPALTGRKDGVEGALRQHNILTACDLVTPGPENAGKVEVIRKLNLVLAKRRLVEKYLKTAMKRRDSQISIK